MTPILPASLFESLVHAHHAEVYRSARRIVANDADALDVTQQVFLRALEGKVSLEESRDRGRVLRWLAARTALAHLRGASTRREKEEQFAMERNEERPDDDATRAEAWAELRRQMASLPDELRTAIVLRFQEGWTFAQIASEQSCSEPSAHDRVQRALERLRGELSRAGFAGIAAVLPRELALDPGGSAVAVPAGLEHQLLGLRAAAAISASTKLAAGVLALISIVAVATAAVWLPKSHGAQHEIGASAADIQSTPAQLPAPAATTRRTAALATTGESNPDANVGLLSNSNRAGDSGESRGTLNGCCVDEDGAPVAGASVFATSTQHSDKSARFSAASATGRDGRFTIAVPVSIEGGEEYVVVTRHLDFVVHTLEKARARTGETTDLGNLALLHSSHDAPGDSTLEVLVHDFAGAPVRNATVSALRTVIGEDGLPREAIEATDQTSSKGRVALVLERLGTKRLRVVPPEGELGATSMTIGIDAPGPFTRTVQLERGLTISGTLVGIGGRLDHGDDPGVGGHGGFLAAYDSEVNSAWNQAEIDDRSGTFVIRGLEDRTYTLVHDGDEWSRVKLENVRGGTSGLAIQLKLESDERDVGDHQAELHGEVHDAKTGALLTLDAFTMDAIYLGDIRGQDWQRDVLPGLIFPRPVQTAMFGEYVPPKAFHLEGLEPGTYAVAARIEGYAPAFAGPFELGRSEMRTGIVINVEAPALLRGVLTDANGKPLANGFARVTGFGPQSSARDRAADDELRATRGQGAIQVWDDVPTDDEGHFEFVALPGWSSLRLVVHHPDFEMAYGGALDLHAGATTDVGRLSIGAHRVR